MIPGSALLVDAWAVLGLAAAAGSLPGSVELLLLSCAALSPARSQRTRQRVAISWRVAVVVPAHDEEANIVSCIESLLSVDHDDIGVDLYVIADNCSDRTAELAETAGAHVLIRTDPLQRGKGYALDFAFKKLEPLHHDCILVVDADTKVKRNFISEAAGAMRDGADAVQAAYLVRNSDQSGKSRLRDLGLRAFNITRLTGRERLGISVGLLGNGFGLRSETLRDVPYLAASVVEDLEYHLMLVANGRKVRFIGQTAVFGEVPLRTEGVRSQRARWEGGRLRIMVRSTPRLLAMILQGKPRLLEPLFELLLLPLAFHAVLLFIALSSPSHLARVIGLSGLFVVWFHLLVTIILGGWNWSEVLALARAPIYIAWKVLLLPSLIQNARSRSLWVRTKRNSER